MSLPSTTAPRWAVSGRTHGEVLTAGVSSPGLEIVLLGVPDGFTPPEIEGWLHDLSGVAIETSRGDLRERAIPALLHHALTGLLFSQAELWNSPKGARPCSTAFVEAGGVCAFGWVGEARVQVMVDGVLLEPRWVLVRDEEGREARATVFHPGQHVMLSLDYWPRGESGSQAPASVEAEWAPEASLEAAHAPALEPEFADTGSTAAAVAPSDEPIVIEPIFHDAPVDESFVLEMPEPVAVEPPAELPVHLMMQEQPGLVSRDVDVPPAEVTAELSAELHSEEIHALTSLEPMAEPSAVEPPAAEELRVPEEPAAESSPAPGAHPVGRWLSRMLGWGRREERPAAPAPAADSDATPLSTYDSLLSDTAASAEPEPEQIPLDLAGMREATSLADLKPFEFVPEQSEFATEYATGFEVLEAPPATIVVESVVPEPEQHPEAPAAVAPAESAATPATPAAPAAPTFGLPAAGLADVLGQAFAPPAPEPEPEPAPEPEPQRFTHVDLLRALSESPIAPASLVPARAPAGPPTIAELRVDHEPVGAADDFAIAPVPGMAAPPVPVSEPLVAPPMLHVKLTPYSPEPAEAAEAAPPLVSPPTLRVPEAPPVLHVSVPEAAAPPVLRVDLPGETPSGPPVLRVEPLPAPPPVIVPTPPVSPVAPAAGFAPTFEPATEGAAAVAAEETPAAPPRLPWPAFDELKLEARPWYRRPQVLGAIVVALFGAGWILGAIANPKSDEPNAFTQMLRAVGLGGARYEVAVDSSPTGAWIAVDGKDAAKRTPAKIELKPGKHALTLTLPELGAATIEVNGRKGESVKVSPSLNGSLEILPADPGVPISVSLDGRPQGYAPITVESLAPGLHEVQFSGPGMAPWAQTIQVVVRKTEQLLARPMSAPGTGVLQVQAMLNDDAGSSPLSGAQVFVDGESRGVTPLSLELPRGPHSIRLTWHGETAPVQVIDLPGGNQRFASFNFGLDTPAPQITIPASSRSMSATQTNMISAAFTELSARDVREAWLHVRTAEGLWRRYAMTAVNGPGVTMMAAVFPPGSFDSTGRTVWYVSATSAQGDEYFSEIQPAYLESAKPARAAKPAAKPAATPAP